MKHLLFLCVANSARSQMAEAIARSLAPDGVAVYSAGSQPDRVNPYAVRALAEIGLDASGHHSKGVDDVPLDLIDAVVTLCAEEVCPTFPRSVPRQDWGLPDPAGADGSDKERLAAFRKVRDELRRRIDALFTS
ncbi:arsenate reductase ArsC [Candidatus Poribacteria bacterium]|jgi:thioredoxin type arsenate reductase|nr:arsenate reductase ArsC [Candidatus Poribacteria bacterium]MBT5531594.1 arsenate reductase ArsC [Candidatus Poribacteria bacterium]MBT5709779.1 arsenate reductase ArsC [Candidatus Poribacteria bacterium]MBT7097014.1 arsenate reductase ArsC [Candidatus Poribacteria bacterium]MBT7805751.1 arsenate reductase ArsC [Candidatus Poribacteria bacterium]